MKQSLEKFVYEIIEMSFLKAGEQILSPNNWDETSAEAQKEAYRKAWITLCEIHGHLFSLMSTIDTFRELREFKKEAK